VEILVDESVFLCVWCGNGVPTRLITRGGEASPYKIFALPLEKYVVHNLKLLGTV